MNNAFRADLIEKLGMEHVEHIGSVRVGIAGAGGLGSNCAANLVRVGFRKLTIVDFDRIEPSNLDRQFYFEDQIGMLKVDALKENLFRINPDLDVRTEPLKLEKANVRMFFGECDVVAECLDRAELKAMLLSELHPLRKFVVSVSGLGGFGSSDAIKVRRINPRLVLIGDLRSDISQKPALSPRVQIAAAKQADVILEHIFLDADPIYLYKG